MKKRVIAVLFGCLVSVSLTGCKSENVTEQSTVQEQIVDGITITLPMSLFGLYDSEEIEGMAAENGIEQVTIHEEDSTVTFTMSREIYQKLLAKQKEDVDDELVKMCEDDSTYPAYEEISYNENMAEFQVVVNDAYDSASDFGMLELFEMGNCYQLLDGVQAEAVSVTVNFYNLQGDLVFSKDTASMTSEYGDDGSQLP